MVHAVDSATAVGASSWSVPSRARSTKKFSSALAGDFARLNLHVALRHSPPSPSPHDREEHGATIVLARHVHLVSYTLHRFGATSAYGASAIDHEFVI